MMDNEFIFFSMCEIWFFSIYFIHLESEEQSNETMIMKCTNLVDEDNKNSDDDNQEDSKKKNKSNTC